MNTSVGVRPSWAGLVLATLFVGTFALAMASALVAGENVRSGGRPLAQWPRLEAGRSGDLTTDAGGVP